MTTLHQNILCSPTQLVHTLSQNWVELLLGYLQGANFVTLAEICDTSLQPAALISERFLFSGLS